ncbi:hypothetical protein FOXG_12445 [Fusarium oxysporum f. sp. lycopersici 4287]|uniref:Uncharacterized protein n=1 Tax=Fusarium oxysporum f. sp. lycopersici (strain 4287 / CBS 123668 / FGSC 9935 / NRRL 34936) TaxID=426428 RepID=A0A0J9VSU7_FUSO4|nr:hypothetical protein FOXG_12445 [Fusarium oxysporum f. sp. lycopersici 4287]KNB13715.1 hypothetical protein FOXG_12445 [Fusarium oxysporum f. sp. lycopersici 4287]
MASIQLDAVKAVLAWQHNGTPRYLAEPDPKSSSIRFTLHLNTTSALFEIQIPISYKQHTKTSAICIHVNPRSIISLTPSVEQDVPDPVKPVLGSTICLNFELNDAITILIPSFISEPVTAARLRSGVILDSLYELVETTSLRVYIPDDALSQDQLESLSSATIQQLNPFSGPDYDISRWFSGRGAKVMTLRDRSGLSRAGTLTDLARKRSQDSTGKRSREVVPNNATIWNKLLELEAVVHNRTRPNTPEDQSRHVQELQADVAKLQTQLIQCEKTALDRETEITKLQTQLTQCEKKVVDGEAEVVKLQTQLTQCEKKVVDLDTELAGLRYTQDNADNEASVIISEIEDTLREHEEKIDFVTRGKDDDEFVDILKEEILSELITRISRG